MPNIANEIKIGMPVYLVDEVDKGEGPVLEIDEGRVFDIDGNSMFYVKYKSGLTFWHPFSDWLDEVFPTKRQAQKRLHDRLHGFV